MEKTLTIDNKAVNFKATGGTLIKYREQFGCEYFNDALILKDYENKMLEALQNKDLDTYKNLQIEYKELYSVIGYKLTWTMAKCANDTISDPVHWLKEFNSFPLTEEILPAVIGLFNKSMSSGDTQQEKSGKEEPLTSENFVACCLLCGLTMRDINEMSVGFLLNTIREHVQIKTGNSDSNTNTYSASQSDFDKF